MQTGNSHNDNLHSPGCNCSACKRKAAMASNPYANWKERRRQRLEPLTAAAPCPCAHCRSKQEDEFEQEHAYAHAHWRQRRNARHGWSEKNLEILEEIPVLQMVSAGEHPVSAIPSIKRFFDTAPVASEMEVGSPRIVYVYFGPKERERMILQWQSRRNLYKGNQRWQMRISRIIDNIKNCRKPHHWRQSEEDVKQQYASRFPRQNSQQAFSKGVRQPGRVSGSTVPDLILPVRAQRNMALRSKQELELIEIKRPSLQHMGSMLHKLTQQITERGKIAPQGRYQSVVLDFRGQEKDCVAIKAAAKQVAQHLRTKTSGVQVLVQVLMWSGCPDSCSLRNESIS